MITTALFELPKEEIITIDGIPHSLIMASIPHATDRKRRKFDPIRYNTTARYLEVKDKRNIIVYWITEPDTSEGMKLADQIWERHGAWYITQIREKHT